MPKQVNEWRRGMEDAAGIVDRRAEKIQHKAKAQRDLDDLANMLLLVGELQEASKAIQKAIRGKHGNKRNF